MPNLRSAFKRLRSDNKKYIRNQRVTTELKTLVKRLQQYIAVKDKQKVTDQLKLVIRKISKAKSKGIIHANTASRKISRLTKQSNPALKA